MNGHIIILDSKQMREDETTEEFAYRVLSQRLIMSADLVAISFENEMDARIIKRRTSMGVGISHTPGNAEYIA